MKIYAYKNEHTDINRQPHDSPRHFSMWTIPVSFPTVATGQGGAQVHGCHAGAHLGKYKKRLHEFLILKNPNRLRHAWRDCGLCACALPRRRRGPKLSHGSIRWGLSPLMVI